MSKEPKRNLSIIVAVLGNGWYHARVRGSEEIVAMANDIWKLEETLTEKYPEGFTIELRHDPQA